MRRLSAVLGVALALSAAPVLAADPLRATAEALRDKALSDPTVGGHTVEALTTEIGPRLVGTPQQKPAMEGGLVAAEERWASRTSTPRNSPPRPG